MPTAAPLAHAVLWHLVDVSSTGEVAEVLIILTLAFSDVPQLQKIVLHQVELDV